MRPTDYGKVPVKVIRDENGTVYLVYPYIDEDQNLTVCPLNSRQGYPHIKLQYDAYRKRRSRAKSVVPTPGYDEALMYLKKYCAYHRMDYRKFMLMVHFGHPLGALEELWNDYEDQTSCTV